MLILAIDTSAVASAALVSDDALEGVVGSFSTEDTRSHAEVLAPGIEKLLAESDVTGADIDAIVVGVGPGPFTGLRSGIATARTLAFAWGKPLHGLMSLDAVALEVAESTEAPREFLVATDARRKEVYWARYTLQEGQLPSSWTGRTLASPPIFPTCPPTVPAPASTRTSCGPTRTSARNSRTRCTWGSSPWRGWRGEGNSLTPRPSTSVNPMRRSPAPGSAPCERPVRRGRADRPGRIGARHGCGRHRGSP